jgi:hypothetical protein
VLPASQVFAVEKLLPLVGIAFASILILISGNRKRDQSSKYKNRNNKSFQHWGISSVFSLIYVGQTNILAPTSGIKSNWSAPLIPEAR